jgi:hypothetical protein
VEDEAWLGGGYGADGGALVRARSKGSAIYRWQGWAAPSLLHEG